MKKKGKYIQGIYTLEKPEKYKGELPIRYRSNYERVFMIKLERDTSVKSWSYEMFKLPYIFEGKKCNYMPDFLVEFKDGKKVLVEVKPYTFAKKAIECMRKGLKDIDRNAAKWESAIKYCKEKGYGFSIQTEKSIFPKFKKKKKLRNG